MVKSNVWIVVLFSTILSINTEAQNKKFWVKFADKTGTPYSISTPTAYLSAKAIQRRSNQGISIDQTDLPCTPAYLSQLNSITDVKVMHASKWLNSALVVITNNNAAAITTATNAINSQSFVVSISPTNKFKISTGKLNESNENMFQEKSNANPTYYGGGFWQARQLNADCIHGHGYRGQNMVISVMDAGFKNVNTLPAFDSLRTRNGILGTYDFVTGGTSVYEDDGHGTSVLSCIAAVVPGVLVGTAPMADFWLLRTEDVASETPSEEYNWIRAAEFADSAGTDIITTSLGYTTMDNSAFSHTQTALNGKTYHMSIAATMASRKGIFVLNSAGNDGGNPWQFIGVPADADSICTVGAIDSLGNVTGFSSKGPTADGRFKPDLVSRGGNAYVANSFGSYSPGNGTSFSCPVMAGAVACFWQRHSTFTNMQVLDTLRKYASNSLAPDNSRGWGIPNMCSLPVGLSKYTKELGGVRLFPNPVKSQLSIATELRNMIYYSVSNVLGQVVLKGSFIESIKVNIESLPKGYYTITLSDGSSTKNEKILVE